MENINEMIGVPIGLERGLYGMKKLWCLMLSMVMTLSFAGTAFGEEAAKGRVYCKGEIADFGEDEPLLELYVCPLLGADAMVMVCGGEVMLVDVGKENHHTEILEILDRLGSRKVDYLYNTHPHDDHIGSFANLIKSGVEIGCMYTGFPEDYAANLSKQKFAMKTAHEANIPVIQVGNGSHLTLGGADIDCVQQLVYSGTNDCSCMLHVTFGDCSMLLTGDVEMLSMDYLVRTESPDRLRSDIMKLPHHGLARLDDDFMDTVNPEYAFITHGIINSTVGQVGLIRLGIPYSFATWGVIHLATNGEYWIVDHELTEDGKTYQQKYQQKYGGVYW